jgi:hypothetical protein
MTDNAESIADLVRMALRDARDLVRSELDLARAELRQEGRRLSAGVGLMAGAAVAAMLALALLLMTIAWGLAAAFEWPVWVGLAIVTAVGFVAAASLALAGRRKLSGRPHFPKTTETMKENSRWIRARTS